MSDAPSPRGLTLIEPLVAMILLAVMAWLAVPPLTPLVEESVVDQAALHVKSALQRARADAILRQNCFSVRLTNEPHTVMLTTTAGRTGPCGPSATVDSPRAEGFVDVLSAKHFGVTSNARLLAPHAVLIESDGTFASGDAVVTVVRGAHRRTVIVEQGGRACIVRDAHDGKKCGASR